MSIATISRLLKIKVEKEDSFQVDFKEYKNNNNHFSTNIDDETKNIDKSSISFVNQNPKQQTNVNSIPPASKMKKEDVNVTYADVVHHCTRCTYMMGQVGHVPCGPRHDPWVAV